MAIDIAGKKIAGIRIVEEAVALTAGVSAEIDLRGGTLIGVLIESEITSTTFILTSARTSGGTFTSLKDPTGQYGTAGSAVSFTVGSTSVGRHFIPAELAVALGRYIKINFDQSETGTVYAVYRSFE